MFVGNRPQPTPQPPFGRIFVPTQPRNRLLAARCGDERFFGTADSTSFVGYARGSTAEGRRVLDRELDAFRASGTTSDHPNFVACLDYLRRGDVLVALDLDLDRLERFASGFSTCIDEFSEHRIGFCDLEFP